MWSFWSYFYSIQQFTVLEFVIQLILIYNMFQIFYCINFFYMLAYFLNFNLFLGIYLVLYDLDIFAIILWIVYGGIIIIFFMYSLMWGELSNFLLFSKNLKFFIFILVSFIYLNSLDLLDFYEIKFFNNLLVNYYEFLSYDNTEELENIGWMLIYLSTYYFLLLSYLLLFSCCAVIVIVLNSKKIKYFNFFFELTKNKNLQFNAIKFQNFYLQDFNFTKENYKERFSINSNTVKFKPKFRRV